MYTLQIHQCRRGRRLYPPRRYYLAHLLPGLLLAITGLVLFAFLETQSNYKYVHSCWHVAMSLSIVFLLPVPPRKEGIDLHTDTSQSVDSVDANTTLATNTSSRILLSSYASGMANGHAVSDIEGGINPAYESPAHT